MIPGIVLVPWESRCWVILTKLCVHACLSILLVLQLLSRKFVVCKLSVLYDKLIKLNMGHLPLHAVACGKKWTISLHFKWSKEDLHFGTCKSVPLNSKLMLISRTCTWNNNRWAPPRSIIICGGWVYLISYQKSSLTAKHCTESCLVGETHNLCRYVVLYFTAIILIGKPYPVQGEGKVPEPVKVRPGRGTEPASVSLASPSSGELDDRRW